jgi:murein DD-endopeptidase MepM/ murein hydrolase activator NlpD
MKIPTASFVVLLALFCVHGVLFAEDTVHVLQRGETLYGVSRKYNVPVDAIMSFNNISNPDRLSAGQKLLIPGMYTVQKGDTLYGIARKLGVPVPELTKANKLSESSTIKAGETLYIPGGPNAVAGAAASKTKPSAPAVALEEAESTKSLEDPRIFKRRKVDSSIIWPVSPREIAYLSGKLYGVSILADQGARVTVISSGTVLSTGPYRGFGNVAFVQSSAGYIYVYGGLGTLTSRPGDMLTFGDELGVLGSDSLSGKPQLYFMVYNREKPIDPAKAPRGY